MATLQLERGQWFQYFDRVSRALPAEKVEVRVEGPDLGDQAEIDPRLGLAVLTGLAYDPRDDVFEVSTATTRHLISHPQAILVEEADDGLRAIEVDDDEGRQQIITLTRVLPLPPT